MSNRRQTQTDEWRPVRTHTVLRRFRRGPGRTIRFVGQQEDETIRHIVREHLIFYARSVLPLLLSLVFLGLVIWIKTTNVLPGSVFPSLYLISGLAIIGSAIYAAYQLLLWWVNVNIVTNKRILIWRGIFTPMRDETTLERVQQVAVDQPLLGIVLSYGTVRINLAGGRALIFPNAPDPESISDDIEGITQSYQAAKPVKAPPPPADAAPAVTLERLARKVPLPKLPDADAKWAHRRSRSGVRRPLRRFGGPLRLECDVHYDAEEYSVMYIQRSLVVLAIRLIIPVLLLVGALIGALVARAFTTQLTIAFFVILIITVLMIINYIDDVFILTNKRVIDINRRFIFLDQRHDMTSYEKINRIEVRSPNFILLALDIGNLFIQTQGNNPDIHMRLISHPFFIQDKIYAIKGFKERVEKVKRSNDRKDELNLLLSTVLTTLEQKSATRAVPDLQFLDLWTAIERASESGMKVVAIGESAGYPDMGSGKIVIQIPPPGTLMNVNPDEKPQIQVILSRQG